MTREFLLQKSQIDDFPEKICYNLEKGDRNILTTYSDTYTWDWSDSYYDNLKKKIDEFMNMRMGENNI